MYYVHTCREAFEVVHPLFLFQLLNVFEPL
jgi:hypothetical protein